MPDLNIFKIFLSSPQQGLTEERDALLALNPRESIKFKAMEWFGASPETPDKVCLKHLEASNAVILLIGDYYGSVHPKENISYTEIEYHRARQRGLMVFPFIKVDAKKKWAPRDRKRSDKSKHLKFFKLISRRHTWASFTSVDDLKKQVLTTLSNYEEFEIKRSGPLVNYRDYFRGLLKKDQLFSHNINMVGRKNELQALGKFTSSKSKVALLIGRGGIGKSKLLYEYAKKQEKKKSKWSRILFIRENFVLNHESLNSIPAGRSVLIIDDAHRVDNLPNLLSVFNSHRKDDFKIILSIRPIGTKLINGILAHSGVQPDLINRLPEISDIHKKDLKEIIRSIIGNKTAAINFIANMTRDCPLATVIASKISKKDKSDLVKIQDSDKFQHAVLDRFIQEVEGDQIYQSGFHQKLLAYISALAPIRPDNTDFKNNLAKLLKVEVYEIEKAIDHLQAKGILIRRGNLARLAPDLLSDHILHRACVSSAGKDLGFADAVFKQYHQTHFANILKNISQLEWRINRNGTPLDLLSKIWGSIETEFKKSHYYERSQLLKEIEKSAFYLPDKALSLVELALTAKKPKRPKKRRSLFDSYDSYWNQSHVLENIPRVLKNIAYNYEYLTEAVKILWEVSKSDSRDLNPHPEHSIRVLQELADYQVGKPIEYNRTVLNILKSLLKENDAFNHRYTPIDIIKKLLDKEVEESSYDAGSMSFWSVPIRYDAVKELREDVIDLLGKLIDKRVSQRTQVEALYVLLDAIGYSHGLFGRPTKKDENDQFLPEQLAILKVIHSKVNKLKSNALNLITRTRLRWFFLFGRHEELKIAIRAIYDAIPETMEYRITRSLANDYEEFLNKEHAFDVQRTRGNKEIKEVSKALLKKAKNPLALFKLIEDRLIELENHKKQSNPNFILSEICKLKPDVGIAMFKLAISPKSKVLFKFCSSLLWPLKDFPRHSKKIRPLIDSALKTNNTDIYHNIAHAYAWGGLSEIFQPQDVKTIQRLIKQSDSQLFRTIVHAIMNIGKSDPVTAKKIAFSIPLAGLKDDLNYYFEIFNNSHGIPFSSLSEPDIDSLLDKIVKLNIFEREDYYVEQFLSQVATKYTSKAVNFIIRRYKYSCQLQKKKSRSEKYVPLPYLGFDSAFRNISSQPKYLDYVRQIRNLSIEKERDNFWLEKLFQAVSENYNLSSLEVFSEWIAKPSASKLVGISILLREAPDNFLFDQSEFIGSLLDAASSVSQRTYKEVCSNIFGIAISGGHSRGFGEASPKHTNLVKRSEEIAKKFGVTHPAYKFYRDVMKYAKNSIAEELARDEEQLI